MNITLVFSSLLLAAALIGGLALAWWGWQNLDASLLMFGSRLC